MKMMLRRGMIWTLGLLWCLLVWGPVARADTTANQPPAIPYSEFLDQVQRGQVTWVRFDQRLLAVRFKEGSQAVVSLPPVAPNLPAYLIQYGVAVEYAEPRTSQWLNFFVRLIPPLLILGGILWFTRREGARGSGVLSVEQSPGRLYRPGTTRVTMQDVAGMDEVKAELQEVVDFLQEGGRYRALGARIPRGILLSGPPGTGKTLLARAVAGEAGVPFLTMSGSDFVEMYAGVGAARVRALFEKARQLSPCILFIDEIDAVARQRGVSIGGGAEERDQTINQLLVEMDGFAPAEGIIVMAATNRIDILDSAILRPGRFDRQILVDPPDRQGRAEILAVHARSKPLAADASLDQIAAMTAGFTGADLANLLNEAALLAARRRNQAIGQDELTQAFERVVAGGPARQRALSGAARLRIAYHEAGHALVGRWLEGPDHVIKVSLVPRGRALGYVMYAPGEERYLQSRQEMLNRLAALLAGRAAEEVALGEGSSGAADDLERATAAARAMVTEWGMHPDLGPTHTADGAAERTRQVVDQAVRGLVLEGYRCARALLAAQRAALDRVAGALMASETLDGATLERLLDEGGGD